MEQRVSEQVTDIIFSHFEQHLNNISKSYKKTRATFLNCRWHNIQELRTERLGLYEMMIEKTANELSNYLGTKKINSDLWLRAKNAYINKLYNHPAPELAETFFNTVFCHLFHRRYYGNKYIFVQPVFATKYLDIFEKKPTHRSISLIDQIENKENIDCNHWQKPLREMILSQFKSSDFANLEKDLADLEQSFVQLTKDFKIQLNFQIRTLNTLFLRNRAAYLVGNLINGDSNFGFLVLFLNSSKGIKIESLITSREEIDLAFSSSRASFMVDCLCPSAVIAFLNEILPFKKSSELYLMIGLHKQGKAEFYRDLLQHSNHSSDQFIPAPGVRGMVMAVFTLPSYPFVFKIIRDKFDQAKNITRAKVREKYQLVKYHDRAGRMIDTLEFSDAAFPIKRFSSELIDYLKEYCADNLEISPNQIVIRHIYIEKRMVPLNLYLKQVDEQQVERVIIEYGNAIKDLAKTNIFVGDMFVKNFGVNQLGNVVLYDYDDIEYITDCNFRKLPEHSFHSGEIYIGEYDVFPEQFVHFLFSEKSHREIFIKHHPEILTLEYWQDLKKSLQSGAVNFST